MPFQLIILKTATEDTDEAFNHYEKTQPGLGDRFLAGVLKRFKEINKHRQYYGFIDKQRIIRDVRLKTFPYLVVDEVKEDKVIVYSVHCANRNPDKLIRK